MQVMLTHPRANGPAGKLPIPVMRLHDLCREHWGYRACSVLCRLRRQHAARLVAHALTTQAMQPHSTGPRSLLAVSAPWRQSLPCVHTTDITTLHSTAPAADQGLAC